MNNLFMCIGSILFALGSIAVGTEPVYGDDSDKGSTIKMSNEDLGSHRRPTSRRRRSKRMEKPGVQGERESDRVRNDQHLGKTMEITDEIKRHMTNKDWKMYERIMKLPAEEREEAAREYVKKREMEGTGKRRNLSEEELNLIRKRDWLIYEKIMKLPPEEREKTAREYIEKREMEEMERQQDLSNKKKSRITDEDRAMYEKIKHLPLDEREKAAQEYKAKREKEERGKHGSKSH